MKRILSLCLLSLCLFAPHLAWSQTNDCEKNAPLFGQTEGACNPQEKATWSLSKRTSPAEPLPREIMTLRLAGYTGLNSNDYFNFYGASAEFRLLMPFTVEAGIEANPLVTSVFGRAGYTVEILRGRDRFSGAGMTMTFGAFLGYRFIHMNDAFGRDDAHAITLNAAYDIYFWMNRRFGFNINFTFGTGFWLWSTDPTMPLIAPEGRVAFGIAF